MKIKRSSWCYKLSTFDGRERRNDNLCRFFWRLVGNVFFVCVLGGAVVSLSVIFYLSPMAIPVLIILAFLFFSVFCSYWVIYYLRKVLGKPPEMPFGDVVSEFFKAKKRKFCPLIEYVE